MKVPFSLLLALREGRSGARRIGVYMGSITLGVAALVAIHSFRGDVERAVQTESRSILGADLRLGRSLPHSDSVRAVVDSAAAAGARVAEVTTLVSMVLAERTQSTRLLQVQGVEEGFPFYGLPKSDPVDAWERLPRGGAALVDEAVLIQLGVGVGDTLTIGTSKIPIAGSVSGLPTDLGFQSAVGPRVFISRGDLARTGLLAFGSIARHRIFLAFSDPLDAKTLKDRYPALWEAGLVSSVTYQEQADELTEGVGILTRFLGLIGLAALLLGGIGVASAIHVYVKEKLTAVAVLRCLGAQQGTAFAAYLIQAAALGLAGAVLGVVLGLGVQRLLPRLTTGFLPVEVTPQTDLTVALIGLFLGLWVSTVFAVIPLLAVRNVPPLKALRQSVEASGGRAARAIGLVVLLASLLAISVWQAPTPGMGATFAAALGGVLLLLRGAAHVLVLAARRLLPLGLSYPVRQGISNLFRPRNQTVTLTVALGFGVFVIATVLVVQRNLQTQLSLDAGGERPNLLLFDLQPDQVDAVVGMVSAVGEGDVPVTPIIPSRIRAINGRSAGDLLADSAEDGPESWAIRRLYRNTYRAELTSTEELVEGSWWTAAVTDSGEPPGQDPSPGGTVAGIPRISMERDVAEDLGVGIGDQITWDVQGISVESRITSLRTVDWAQFAPNFFVVFEPGSLDSAPQTSMAFARVSDPGDRARLQTDLVSAHPNVSVLDLATVQETLDRILGTVGRAIRFLALFAIIGGLTVLIGTLATSRFQRLREGALLKTLGGQRGQILSVFLTEYAALGTLSALAGTLLGVAAAWALVRYAFEASFSLPSPPLVALFLGVVTLTVLAGFLMSRSVLGRTPLDVLREVE